MAWGCHTWPFWTNESHTTSPVSGLANTIRISTSSRSKSHQWPDLQTFTISYSPLLRHLSGLVMGQEGDTAAGLLGGECFAQRCHKVIFATCSIESQPLWGCPKQPTGRLQVKMIGSTSQLGSDRIINTQGASLVAGRNSSICVNLLLKLSDMTGLTFCH